MTNEIRSLSPASKASKKEKRKEKEGIHVISKRKKKKAAQVDAGVASAFDKRCARRAPVARVTCGRRGREGSSSSRRRGRERPPELLLSQEGLAASGGLVCVRVSALLEKKKEKGE